MSDIKDIGRQAAREADKNADGFPRSDRFLRDAMADAVTLAVLQHLRSEFLSAVPPPQTPEPPKSLDVLLPKAIKLLEALAEPHEKDCNDDHRWSRCRRCLAQEELDHKGADDLLLALLAKVRQS